MPIRKERRGVLRWTDNTYGRRWMRGRWEVQPARPGEQALRFAFHCDAYIDHRGDRMIRMVFDRSTRAQRESKLFALQPAGGVPVVIDGTELTFEATTRLAQR